MQMSNALHVQKAMLGVYYDHGSMHLLLRYCTKKAGLTLSTKNTGLKVRGTGRCEATAVARWCSCAVAS